MLAAFLIVFGALLVVLEMAAYRYARQMLGMPKPWYSCIPGAGFVLLHQAIREEYRE